MVAKTKPTILIDSDAWVAFMHEDDAHAKHVRDIFFKLEHASAQFMMTNYVFAETVSVVSKRAGRDTALAFIRTIKQPQAHLRTIWVGEELESLAISIYKRQTSKNISFVDCTNMAALEQYDIDAIFSFDRVYAQNNFTLAKDIA